MRKEIIAGNWKMFKTAEETTEYFDLYAKKLDSHDREVMIFTPYTDLSAALNGADGTGITIGAQNMHFEDSGAYTGEISASMLKACGIGSVLIGHSERRKYFAESDESVNKKLLKALAEDMTPMVCVGESLQQRENGETFDVLRDQIQKGLAGGCCVRTAVAYEPVWAIGTGRTATDEQAQEACGFIRECLRGMAGAIADEMRILYGGSVNTGNIKGIMAQPDVDGVLVGGASLKEDFIKIVNYDKQ